MEESHLPQLPQLPQEQQVVSAGHEVAPDVDAEDAAGVTEEGAGEGRVPAPSSPEKECPETENTEVLQSLKRDLNPPVSSLDDCHDMDVPSEVPFMLQPPVEDIVSHTSAPGPQVTQPLMSPAGAVAVDAVGVQTARTLVEQRRVDTALQGLPSGKYGTEGALLRLKCFIQLRKFADAAKECETEELKDSFEAQLFLAQAPYLLRQDGSAALRKLQELSEAWQKKGPESMDLRLKLLQVFSQLSLQVGHGSVALAALQRALDGGEGAKCQLWSLLGRHHLSWGNLHAAKDAFETARSLGPAQDAGLFLNEGLLAMAQGDYAHARGFFESAATTASDEEEALAAENNLAVCKFYTKDLPGACRRLEALVKQDALRFLKPCLLQNLVSLYEFSQDAALKRQELHALAKTAQLEDLDPQLFKAPM